MKPFTFVFTPNEINTLLMGLGELPAKMSIGLIGKIERAIEEQKKQPEPPLAEQPLAAG